MTRVWWLVKLCYPLYNTYLSALEAKLLQLSAIQQRLLYYYITADDGRSDQRRYRDIMCTNRHKKVP